MRTRRGTTTLIGASTLGLALSGALGLLLLGLQVAPTAPDVTRSPQAIIASAALPLSALTVDGLAHACATSVSSPRRTFRQSRSPLALSAVPARDVTSRAVLCRPLFAHKSLAVRRTVIAPLRC